MGEKRLKVLHVIPSVYLGHGGPSYAICVIETALTEAGVEVETATSDDDGVGQRNGKAGLIEYSETGVRRHYFRKVIEFYKIAPKFAVWALGAITRYDVVHIHALFSFTTLAAAFAAKVRGVPYVVRPLGTLSKYGISKRRPLLKRLSLRFIEGPILSNAAAVHFTSESERLQAELLGIAMRGVVIPLAVETPPVVSPDAFYALAPELLGREYALYLSRLDPKKNVEGLLRAFALVLLQFPDLRLAVAGSGEPEYVERLRQLATEIGVQQSVVWLGQVEGEVKAGALRSAKLFVLPSFSENFGIAAAEALAAGLPCVLGAGVALADDMKAAGAGEVVSTDPTEIAAAFIRLLSNDAYRAACGANAAKLARERFSPDEMGRRLVALYREIQSKSVSGESTKPRGLT